MDTLIRLFKLLGILWILPWIFLGIVVLLALTAIVIQNYN